MQTLVEVLLMKVVPDLLQCSSKLPDIILLNDLVIVI